MLSDNKKVLYLIQHFTFVSRTLVPRAGVEPARVAPLVFETSASTDSAIWACHLATDSQTKAGAKVIQKNEMAKVFDKKLKNTCSYHRF